MNIFFAMGIPNTTDDQGYLLWLSHTWTVFIPPVLALCVALSVWIIRKIRHLSSAPPRPPSQSAEPCQDRANPQPSSSGSDAESAMRWPLEPATCAVIN